MFDTEQERNAVYTLMSKVSAMKPNKVKENADIKHHVRLESLLDSAEYAAEDKIDGCRYFTAGCLFFSKDKVEKTANFPHLTKVFIDLGFPNLILDGEINYPNKTSQYCTRVTGAAADTAIAFQKSNGYIHYTLYDILRTPKGTWAVREPYKTRRKMLEYFYNTYIKGTPAEEYIHISDMTMDNKREFKDNIIANGGEGIVLKHIESVYQMGKSPMWQWMKIKQKDEADMIILGFEEPSMDYKGTDFENWPYWKEINGISRPVTKPYYMGWVGAAVLGVYKDGELIKLCTASGFTDEEQERIKNNPEFYIGKVARIGYMEMTEAGIPRHPKFLELHPDKQPEECIWGD